MKKTLLTLFLLITTIASSAQLVDDKYVIHFGNPEAPNVVREYISFECLQCVKLFKEDFDSIEREYITSDEFRWEFCLIPTDITTLKAMVCLEQLSEEEKLVFLYGIWSEVPLDHLGDMSILMVRAMDYFEKPLSDLNDYEFIMQHPILEESFRYQAQKDRIVAVPTMEYKGIIYREEIPNKIFIDSILRGTK